MEPIYFTHHFLIAMPALVDPYFNRALIYVCEHNAQGALGVIVNKPLDLTLEGLFEKVDLELKTREIASLPVHFGGPVQMDRGFVLHSPPGEWQSSMQVNQEIGLTSSKDILASISQNGQPDNIILTLGYAGWSAGQLENELAQNAWLTIPANSEILFRQSPEERLPAAMQKLGISFAQLSDVAGHA
ncbi:MAG: YqgE/AlgH family protein [Betaproteobacteria bacterium]|nr:YqgE/AlgH family protein [Betaproteobacteria bacterium]